jgi:hypothetical protein
VSLEHGSQNRTLRLIVHSRNFTRIYDMNLEDDLEGGHTIRNCPIPDQPSQELKAPAIPGVNDDKESSWSDWKYSPLVTSRASIALADSSAKANANVTTTNPPQSIEYAGVVAVMPF